MTPQELDEELTSEADIQIVDVREADEVGVSMLPGAIHIPMGDIEARHAELSNQRRTVVVCRSGGRSGKVTQYLSTQGFDRVYNLQGGMQAWAREVDPHLPVA